MKKQKTITIPESLADITVRQLAQYMASDLSSEESAAKAALHIFVGLSPQEQERTIKTQLKEVAASLSVVLNQKPTVKTKFEYNGKRWGLVPNLDEITAGEYIDADSYLGDWARMHNFLSVLYRPIIKEGKGWYEIEPYSGTNAYANELQDAPADIAVGLLVFFWTLGVQLSNATIEHLQQKQTDAGLTPLLNLVVDGGGILPYSTYRAETYSYLMKLLNYQYTSS